MRKILSLLLALFVFLSLSVTVSAATLPDDSSISIDEYERMIQAEGKKYGIDAFVISYNSQKQITPEVVASGLDSVRKYAESRSAEAVILPKNPPSDIGGSVSPFGIMPSTKDYAVYFSIANVYGRASMLLETNVTTNLANGTIMYVNSVSASQSGYFVNFVSWETTSIPYVKDSPSNGFVTFTVNGRATFSYADPVTGITTGYTSNESCSVQVDCR